MKPAFALPITAALALVGIGVGSSLCAHRPAAHADGKPTLVGYAPAKSAAANKKVAVTYARDIAPILNANCASCHRTGEIGPFALMSYQDAKKRATQLAAVTESRFMPPWHAESHGEFLDERKLTPEQIAMLKQWAEEGAPFGDKKLEPAAPHFTEGWSLGKPDMVLTPSKPFTLAAEGADVYRCFVLPTDITEDRYISAIEVRPGNSKIVHHVIAFLDSSKKARQIEAANTDGQPGYTAYGGIGIAPTGALGGWAPGNFPRLQPDGIGTLLPKGADVVLQVHYHKSGKPETDQTRIGVYFCKAPVDKRLRVMPVIYPFLKIPPGDAGYTVNAIPMPVSNDITVRGVMPHMHLLGKEMTVTATLPDKSAKTLVHVPNYDFNWQTTYQYKNPVPLPAGSSFGMTARYDNSTSNPRNPSSPPHEVHWGEQTTDEMCIAFVYYTVDKEHLTKGEPVYDWLDKLTASRRRAKAGN